MVASADVIADDATIFRRVFRNTGMTDVMPVFAAAIFRVMTMCCQYLEYC